MSKVNELRRKATEAVRGREFDRAIKLYGKICELDPSNGTPRNELGDLYLKTGNTFDAIDCFSLSARLYNEFGLTNNAVAVFKKILRHDPNHLDSLWGLAEIRREQGLDAEASAGFLEFLSRSDQVPEAGRKAFLDRARELLKSMADDMEILSRLEEIHRADDSGDDVASVLVAKAMQAHLEEEFEVRDRYIEHAREACDIFDSLPAYHDYLDITDPVKYSGGSDPVEADDSGTSDASGPEPGVIEINESDFDSAFADPVSVADSAEEDDEAGSADPVDEEVEDSGPATVMINTEALDLGFDFDELEDGDDPVSMPSEPVEPAVDEEVEDGVEESPVAAATVNLLDEILADESFDMVRDQQSQLDTIAQEMQGQIAGDVDPSDFGGQYELGIVYMDMGLYEQAIAAFDAASRGKDYELGALEMRGTCLLRLGRDTEAMDSFRAGLDIEGAPDKAYLGLLYGMGCCLELRENFDEARTYFQRVAAVDPGFLNVAAKLERTGEPR